MLNDVCYIAQIYFTRILLLERAKELRKYYSQCIDGKESRRVDMFQQWVFLIIVTCIDSTEMSLKEELVTQHCP